MAQAPNHASRQASEQHIRPRTNKNFATNAGGALIPNVLQTVCLLVSGPRRVRKVGDPMCAVNVRRRGEVLEIAQENLTPGYHPALGRCRLVEVLDITSQVSAELLDKGSGQLPVVRFKSTGGLLRACGLGAYRKSYRSSSNSGNCVRPERMREEWRISQTLLHGWLGSPGWRPSSPRSRPTITIIAHKLKLGGQT